MNEELLHNLNILENYIQVLVDTTIKRNTKINRCHVYGDANHACLLELSKEIIMKCIEQYNDFLKDYRVSNGRLIKILSRKERKRCNHNWYPTDIRSWRMCCIVCGACSR